MLAAPSTACPGATCPAAWADNPTLSGGVSLMRLSSDEPLQETSIQRPRLQRAAVVHRSWPESLANDRAGRTIVGSP